MNEALKLIPPEHMVYIALVIGGLVRLLKTETMSSWLERLPPSWIGAIPKRALPWVALSLAMAVSVIDLKLTAPSSTWKEVFLVTVQGVFSGSLAIAGHETIAKTVGKIVKIPPTTVLFIFAMMTVPLAGCAPAMAALPHIVAAVVDAGQIVDTIAFFISKRGLDPAAQAKIDAAVLKAKTAMNVLLRTANGLQDADAGKIDQAFANFRAAYEELLALTRPYGVIPNESELSPKLALGQDEKGPTLSVPTPLALDMRGQR